MKKEGKKLTSNVAVYDEKKIKSSEEFITHTFKPVALGRIH